MAKVVIELDDSNDAREIITGVTELSRFLSKNVTLKLRGAAVAITAGLSVNENYRAYVKALEKSIELQVEDPTKTWLIEFQIDADQPAWARYVTALVKNAKSFEEACDRIIAVDKWKDASHFELVSI